MKRTWLCLLFLLILGALSAARAETTTLLMYVCGASIQDEACDDIEEMTRANIGDDVNVVILTGGASEWDFEGIEGNTRTLITLKDGDFDTVEDWGWQSMGSGESLLEFMEYGLREYPADRTVMVLWDHGAGSEGGMCFDYTTDDQDGLSLVEINDVLYDLSESMGDDFHIDVLGCDACMMATYEMAAMLSYYDIDYFVASEELESGMGWDYEAVLNALADDPGMSNVELCELIIDSYMESALDYDPNDYLTLSAIDLGEIEALQESFEAFAGSLKGEIEGGNVAEVRRERSRMYTFGSFVDGSWDMVDMAAMLDAYARIDPDAAAQARKHLSKAVAINRQTDNLDPCCGLSVLIPQDTKNEFEAYSEGLDLSFYIPNWIGFVKAYAAEISGGSYSFTPPQAEQATGDGFIAHIASLFDAPSDSLGWDDDEQVYAPQTQAAAPVTFGEGDYAFTAKLSAEDMQYLDFVEGMLAFDVSDEELSGYVDFGLMRNNLIDWKTGEVFSLFDGTWPVFDGQLVPLYDQLSNERGRRSLMPVKLNGEATYLVVEFDADSREGRILGANAGYDENGLPLRGATRLKEGDRIIPVYTMYVDTGAEDMEETEFDGDEIIWHEGMTVTYEPLGDAESEDEKLDVMFCFVLNDVFGEYQMTDLISFEV